MLGLCLPVIITYASYSLLHMADTALHFYSIGEELTHY